mmetsp:Transcript_29957/g.62880  ORF Transcript_29957/g.62880 Transcript_29957/m.62880 type:complete len:82 (+) Transcript_29957:100-345(+)
MHRNASSTPTSPVLCSTFTEENDAGVGGIDPPGRGSARGQSPARRDAPRESTPTSSIVDERYAEFAHALQNAYALLPKQKE